MALNKIGASIVLEGEKEYRAALKSINSEQKVLASEMNLVSTTYKNAQNGIEALTDSYDLLNKSIDKQKEKISVYENALASAEKAQKAASDQVDKYRTNLAEAQEKLHEMSLSEDTTNEELKEQEALVKSLENELSKAESNYDKTTNSVNMWKTGLTNSKTALIGLEEDLDKNKKYLDEANNSSDRMATSIDRLGKEAEKTEDDILTFGEALKANLASEAIINAVKMLADKIQDIASSVIDTGSTFEANMSQVAATMGMTSDEIANGSKAFETLNNAAQECGATTMFSASEAAEALNYLALAGYDAEKSAETLPKVLNLAAAGGLDLATASDMVTDSMAALGLETDQLDNYIDEMARTAQKSNTSVSQLGEATLVCAGVVTSTGQSLETMNAELGVLANNGIKGAEGGTHLRNVLLSLSAPTEAARKTLNQLGISVSNSDGSMRDLNDIMRDLNKELGNLGEVEKTQIISTIFNKTDIAAVNALLKGSNDEFANLADELNNCAGAAENMAETMQDNLQGKLTILKSALEGLQITAYDLFDDVLKDGVDNATDAVSKLNDELANGNLGKSVASLAESFGELIADLLEIGQRILPIIVTGMDGLVTVTDALLPLIEGVGFGFLAFKAAGVIIAGVQLAMQAYAVATEIACGAQLSLNAAIKANPIALVLGALVALTTAVISYSKSIETETSETQALIDANNELIKQEQEQIDARKDSATSRAAEAETITNLKDELIDLNSQQELTNDEQARMKTIVEELNQAMPDLNLALDEETGHLTATNDEIEKQIENRQSLLMLQAAEADLTEIANEIYEAEKAKNEILQQNAEALEEANYWANQYEQALANEQQYVWIDDVAYSIDALYNNYINATNAANEFKGQADSQGSVIAELQNEYNGVSNTLNGYQQQVNATSTALEEQASKTVVWRDRFVTLTGDTVTALESLEGEYAEAKLAAEESLGGQIGLFEQLSGESDLTVNEMATNLQSQTDTMNQYADDMTKAMQLVEDGMMDEGLLGSIQQMGIDGAGYLHELVVAAEEDTEAYQEVMDAWSDQQAALDNLSGQFASFEIDYDNRMDALMLSTITTGDNMSSDVTETGQEMVTTATQTASDVETAILNGEEGITTAVSTVSEAAISSAQDTLGIDETGNSQQGMTIGTSFGDSIRIGVENQKDSIVDAVNSVMQAAIDAANAKAQELNRALGGAMD